MEGRVRDRRSERCREGSHALCPESGCHCLCHRGHPAAASRPVWEPAPPFSIGAEVWPGLAKLAEELGELVQVIGKVMAFPEIAEHPDGTNLHSRLEDEIGDVTAAILYVVQENDQIVSEAVQERAGEKLERFDTWHREERA